MVIDMKPKSIQDMNDRQKKRNSFAGKTVRLIVFLTLMIGITAGVFVFFLYYFSLDYAYRTNTWQDARIISQSLDVNELADLAETVSGVYETLTEEDLHDHEKKHLNKYQSVYNSPSYYGQLRILRDAWKASDDEAVFIAFIDTKHNRMVYLMDADDSENQCPPGYWDECSPDATATFMEENDIPWFDSLFADKKIPAVTYRMEKYGFRACAAEKLFSFGEYPVFVFCEEDMNHAVRTSIWFIIHYAMLITIVMVIVLIVTIRRTKKRTVIPVNEMAAAASEYARDNREGRHGAPHFSNLNIRTGDEIEVLSIAMKDMEHELAEYVQNLTRVTREKERVSTELTLANRIQAAMLPSDFPPFPDRREFDIYASMTPAKEVGGDFYDFFFLDGNHLAIVMADVSDKGIPAAMFMMLTKNMIQTRMMTGGTPAQVLEDVNEMVCANNRENMFVTVWLGILDTETGVLTASNAGHENPILRMPGEDFRVVEDEHGIVIGSFDGSEYTDYELNLKPGAILFAYTDGVPEATNADREQFGLERTLGALNSCGDGNPEAVLSAVHERVKVFTGEAEQFDDLTMLCIRYNGKRV